MPPARFSASALNALLAGWPGLLITIGLPAFVAAAMSVEAGIIVVIGIPRICSTLSASSPPASSARLRPRCRLVERRVGDEGWRSCRFGWWSDHHKKKCVYVTEFKK